MNRQKRREPLDWWYGLPWWLTFAIAVAIWAFAIDVWVCNFMEWLGKR